MNQHDLTSRPCARALRASIITSLLLALVALDGTTTVRVHGQTIGREYHVAPSGVATNDGSSTRPLDLTTALSSTSPARPGDTIWLHDGTYLAPVVSRLTGTASAPIIVRQYPGERATIDGGTTALDALTVHGAHTWFWGFEITSSDPRRVSSESGSWPSDLRRGYGAVTRAPGIRFINLVVHDNANGIGLWQESVGSEAYGNILYYNGWQGTDRAHGHGIYTQNQTGVRRIVDNILFDQFSHGVHAYGSSAASLDNITLEGNIAFMNGSISAGGIYESGRELLLGGYRVAANPVVEANATYAGQSNFGYSAGCTNGRMTNNYFAGATILVACNPQMTGNNFYDPNWPRYGTWPTQYPQNVFHGARPTTTVVRVRPNAYEPGRAHIAIYNWSRSASVMVDLAPARLPLGAAFEIRDARNFFGSPVATGNYNGTPVLVPMSGLVAADAVGNVPRRPVHNAPDFGAFVVLPVSGAVPSAPVADVSLSPLTIVSGQSSTLTWSTTGATSVSIAPGIGTVASSGSRAVSPSATTTYVLTATNAAGQTATDQVTLSVGTQATPVVRLTAPLTGQSVPVAVPVALEAALDNGSGVTGVTFLVNGAAIGTVAQAPYRFSWTPTVAGTYALSARANGASGVLAQSAPVSITVTTAPPPSTASVRITAPTANAVFLNQGTISLAAEALGSGITKVEFYRNGTMIGTSYRAPFQLQWTYVPTGTYALTARSYNASGVVATSAPVDIRVTQPPAVRLTSPTAGVQALGSPITVTATASDTDGTIARVEFYSGTTLLGQSTAAPYSYRWTGATSGAYALTARAYDNLGASTTSAAVAVTVNAPPVVQILQPSAASSYPNQGTVTLEASASDSDGRVTRVEYYRGTSIIGTATASPFRVNWSYVPTGTYTLTARAYDDKGSIATSTEVTITVRATGQ